MTDDEIIVKALYPTAAAIFETADGIGARVAEHAAVEALRAALPIIREALSEDQQ